MPVRSMQIVFNKPPEPPLPGGDLKAIVTFSRRRARYRLIVDELTENELMAVASITIQWARLEHLLYARTDQMATKAGIPLPSEAGKVAFNRRLTAWLQLARSDVVPSAQRKANLSLHGRIARAAKRRDAITHGLWHFDQSEPVKLTASSFHVTMGFRESFDLEKLRKLEAEIGEINFALHYPDGPESAVPSSSYASRRLLLALQG